MIVECGSQNVSRIPGQYAYPVQRYQSNPIQPVAAIRANPTDSLPSGRRADLAPDRLELSDAVRRSREVNPRNDLFRPDMYEIREAERGGSRPAAPSVAELAREADSARESSQSYANSVFQARSAVQSGQLINMLG
mgnify:CR=1 FL=1